MNERKTVAELISSWLHEASVLVAVFGLLDKALRWDLTLSWTLSMLAVALILFVLGAVVERRR